MDAGDYAGAVAAYDEILSFAQNTTYRALQQYHAGQALAAAGDEPGAIVRWQAATQEEPSASSAYLALVELGFDGVTGPAVSLSRTNGTPE